MFDFRVLVVIVLAIVGFGLVPLLGAFLPMQLEDEEEENRKNSSD